MTFPSTAPLADAVADAPHVWPNTALPLKAQAQLDKVEAVAGSHGAGQGSASQVEQETDDIHVALAELQQRFESNGLAPDYYTPEVHKAAFALPGYVAKLMP